MVARPSHSRLSVDQPFWPVDARSIQALAALRPALHVDLLGIASTLEQGSSLCPHRTGDLPPLPPDNRDQPENLGCRGRDVHRGRARIRRGLTDYYDERGGLADLKVNGEESRMVVHTPVQPILACSSPRSTGPSTGWTRSKSFRWYRSSACVTGKSSYCATTSRRPRWTDIGKCNSVWPSTISFALAAEVIGVAFPRGGHRSPYPPHRVATGHRVCPLPTEGPGPVPRGPPTMQALVGTRMPRLRPGCRRLCLVRC
jgi:hypothetical protein